jgi:hypothetical protein
MCVYQCDDFRQRELPHSWDKLCFFYMPLAQFRLLIKDQFMKTAHIRDPRIVDRLVSKVCVSCSPLIVLPLSQGELELMATKLRWNNPDHIQNYLSRENVERKANDFLSKFFRGKE